MLNERENGTACSAMHDAPRLLPAPPLQLSRPTAIQAVRPPAKPVTEVLGEETFVMSQAAQCFSARSLDLSTQSTLDSHASESAAGYRIRSAPSFLGARLKRRPFRTPSDRGAFSTSTRKHRLIRTNNRLTIISLGPHRTIFPLYHTVSYGFENRNTKREL